MPESIDWVWLASNSVMNSPHNRVVVPEKAVSLNIARPERSMNWGHNTETKEVMLSRFDSGFDNEDTSYKYNDNITLQDTRAATIPLQFMWKGADEEEGDESALTGKNVLDSPLERELRFRYGETLHFITGKPLMRYNMCYALKDDEGRKRIDESLHDVMTDGGWNVLESDVEDLAVPESYIGDDEVLILDSGDVISVEELREQWAEEIPEYIPKGGEEVETDVLHRHLEVLRIVIEKEPIGIDEISNITDYPQYEVQSSLRVLEGENLIEPSRWGATTTEEAAEFVNNLDGRIDEIIDKNR